LVNLLGRITVPACVIAAYIILGLLLIGHEIENPFGNDVNDLPLDIFCQQIVADISIVTARPRPEFATLLKNDKNLPLFPLSMSSYADWEQRSEKSIMEKVRYKTELAFNMQKEADEREAEATIMAQISAMMPSMMMGSSKKPEEQTLLV
jgi:putative membrane protein